MSEPDELSSRLRATADTLLELRSAVLAREPWPLAADFGHSDEASWGPPEVLAHVTEMLPYWLGEVERVLAGGPGSAPFGRVATDEVRIALVGRDRTVPLRDLFDRVESDVERYEGRLGGLTAADLARQGLHPSLGPMTVGQMLERLVIEHLAEHSTQLRETLETPPT